MAHGAIQKIKTELCVSPACPLCGYVHSSDDAQAVGRFLATPTTFIAKHGCVPRRTREEAESDECAWRVSNAEQREAKPCQAELALPMVVKQTPKPAQTFPAATMEIAAREKAWLDFLAHINFSLTVWQIDEK